MFKVMLSLAVCTLLGANCFFYGQTSVPESERKDLAAMQLEKVQIKAQTIGSLFSDLSLSYSIPIGLEIAANENGFGTYEIDFETGSLSDLLRQFVARHNRYTWEIRDDVVNVFPTKGHRDLLSKDLLGVKIEKFSVKEKTSCWNFVASLLDRPETKSILQANGTTYRSRSPSGFYIPQLGRSFSLNVSDLTVRSILNSVISKSSIAKFWVVTRNSDGTLLLDVSAQHEDALKTKGDRSLRDLFGEKPRP